MVKLRVGTGVEEPKIVLQRGWSLGKYRIHIVALIATGIVVGFNFSNRHAWDQGRLRKLTDDEAINALQFVAKLHEIIIVGSLSSILLHHIRRRLFGPKGIPLGLLSSGYQSSSAEYLCSKEFWSSFRNNKILTIILCISIVYTNMVGPSSAVALIPSLNWFPVAVPSKGQARLYLNGTFDQVYPSIFGPPNETTYAGCDNESYSFRCPGAGFTSIYDWVDTWYNEGVEGNVTMVERFSSTSRILSASTDGGGALITTLTQPIMELTGRFWNYVQAMGIGGKYVESVQLGEINDVERPMFVSDDTAPIYGPVVQVQCSVFRYSDPLKTNDSSSSHITFPIERLFDYSGTGTQGSLRWPVDPSLWNFSRPLNATNFTWVDVSPYKNDAGILASLAAIITLPDTGISSIVRNDTYTSKQISWTVPCVISARWAAASIQYDPMNNSSISYNISDPSVLIPHNGGKGTDLSQQWGLSKVISVSPKWATLLDIPDVRGTHTGSQNTSSLQSLLDRFTTSDSSLDNETSYKFDDPACRDTMSSIDGECDSDIARIMGTILSMVVADGLSRHAYMWAQPYVLLDQDPDNLHFTPIEGVGWVGGDGELHAWLNGSYSLLEGNYPTLPTWTHFTLDAQRYGYGYSYRDNSTVQFALTILLIHAALAMGHIVHLLYLRWKGYTSSAWGTMGEMMALALVSRKAKGLRNVGAGVEKRESWSKVVRVWGRDGDRVELVVGKQDRGARRLEVWKKYR